MNTKGMMMTIPAANNNGSQTPQNHRALAGGDHVVSPSVIPAAAHTRRE